MSVANIYHHKIRGPGHKTNFHFGEFVVQISAAFIGYPLCLAQMLVILERCGSCGSAAVFCEDPGPDHPAQRHPRYASRPVRESSKKCAEQQCFVLRERTAAYQGDEIGRASCRERV